MCVSLKESNSNTYSKHLKEKTTYQHDQREKVMPKQTPLLHFVEFLYCQTVFQKSEGRSITKQQRMLEMCSFSKLISSDTAEIQNGGICCFWIHLNSFTNRRMHRWMLGSTLPSFKFIYLKIGAYFVFYLSVSPPISK